MTTLTQEQYYVAGDTLVAAAKYPKTTRIIVSKYDEVLYEVVFHQINNPIGGRTLHMIGADVQPFVESINASGKFMKVDNKDFYDKILGEWLLKQ